MARRRFPAEEETRLRVPVALGPEGGHFVPREAVRRGRYACPECGGRVIVREGPARVRHFAHHRVPERCRLTGESAVHVGAKHVVAGAVRRWRAGRILPPEVESFCAGCGARVEKRPLRESVKDAAVEREVRAPRGEACRFDVAMLGTGGRVILGVEIRHAHAVPEGKRLLLRSLGIPWIEVLATQALADEGARLVAVRAERTGLAFECPACGSERQSSARRASALRRAERLAAPRSRFERSLAEAPSWTGRQKEALGRLYGPDRAARLLEFLCIAYPESRHLRSLSSRLALTGSIPALQAGWLVWVAQRRPSPVALGTLPAAPPPARAVPPRPRVRTLFDGDVG
jgi:predicted RNA-binding Zn-ribbon protein involved in translation (DUF1610 family)